jgi:uncharacterized protein (TIGR04255 family)
MFAPANEQHAIIEAVYGMTFARAFSPSSISTLELADTEVKRFLPRVSRINALEVAIGDQMNIASTPVIAPGGIVFDRVKPDGNLHSRLRVENNSLFTNSLDYQGWNDFFPRSSKMIDETLAIISTIDNPITSSILQYIDIFSWAADPAGYDISKLIKKESEFVPINLFLNDKLWHLHRGWFSELEEPVGGRVLNRVHIDGLQRQDGVFFVKFDVFVQIETHKAAPPYRYHSGLGIEVAETLHVIAKGLLSSYLTDEMVERIGLWRK